jgi:DNA-binding IclR family transcriptional regulator
MIKVMKKTFDILELIATAHNGVMFSGEIAKQLKLNAATCSRILGDLTELGYLEKGEIRNSYQLGPMAYALTSGVSYRKDILVKSEALVYKCAMDIKESVLLAVLKNNRRYVLCHYNGNAELAVRIDRPYYNDIYTTVTGKILLAYADSSTIDRIINFYGLPEERWDDIKDKDTLLKKLAELRNKGFVSGLTSPQVAIFAYPIFQRGKCVAALGVTLPKMNFEAKKEELLNKAKATAEAISSAL